MGCTRYNHYRFSSKGKNHQWRVLCLSKGTAQRESNEKTTAFDQEESAHLRSRKPKLVWATKCSFHKEIWLLRWTHRLNKHLLRPSKNLNMRKECWNISWTEYSQENCIEKWNLCEKPVFHSNLALRGNNVVRRLHIIGRITQIKNFVTYN